MHLKVANMVTVTTQYLQDVSTFECSYILLVLWLQHKVWFILSREISAKGLAPVKVNECLLLAIRVWVDGYHSGFLELSSMEDSDEVFKFKFRFSSRLRNG